MCTDGQSAPEADLMDLRLGVGQRWLGRGSLTNPAPRSLLQRERLARESSAALGLCDG